MRRADEPGRRGSGRPGREGSEPDRKRAGAKGSGSERKGSGSERPGRKGSGSERPAGKGRGDERRKGADSDWSGGKGTGSDRPGRKGAASDRKGSGTERPAGRGRGSERPGRAGADSGGKGAGSDRPGRAGADSGGKGAGSERPAGKGRGGERRKGADSDWSGRKGAGSERPGRKGSGSERPAAEGSGRPSRAGADSGERRGVRPPRAAHRSEEPGFERDFHDDIVYGRRTVLETLRAGRPLNRLYVLAGAQGLPAELFQLARDHNVPVVRCERDRLERLTRGGNHQGLVAQVATREFMSADDLLGSLSRGRNSLLLALDGIQDPHNLGALLRTAEAAGVEGVLLSARGSCGLTPAVSRASAGADQYLRIARTEKLERVLKELAQRGFAIIGADMAGETLFGGADLTGPTVIVLGAEGEGMRPQVAAACTRRLKLPMLGKIESLNVSVSGALFLYEVIRQRKIE